jgi:peptidoglycan/xylan/chitin deacetylase (PgdA/CDA1 family)
VPLDETGEIYYRWDDRRVLCAAGVDTVSGNSLDSIRGALDRALADESVVLLFGHEPGGTLPLDRLDAVLAHAAAIGLPPVTFTELAAGGPPRAGYSLSLDDAHVDAWYDARPIFDRHGARISFFVTRYQAMREPQRARLAELAADGHDVQAHTVDHLRAPLYVEEHGLDAYLADEALPSIDALRDDGYHVVAFAYPFGARTSELDDALLEHVPLLRSVSFSTGYPGIVDPCPE